MHIPVQSYFDYSTCLQEEEKIFVTEFAKWLPNKIVDCHVHANSAESLIGISDVLYKNMVSTFPWFSIEQHKYINNTFYPLKKVIMLMFAMPYNGIDFRLANQQLLNWSEDYEDIKPVLYGIPDDINYTLEQLETRKFFGLKMYPLYYCPAATRIDQYFPNEILTFLNYIKGTAILHVPATITLSYIDVIKTAERFLDTRFVIAHMGSTGLSLDYLEYCYQELEKLPNIVMDTALVCSTEVIKMGLNIFGHKRILYGTDQPLSLVRAKMYVHPELGERLAVSYPYHWVDQNEQKQFVNCKEHINHLHWANLNCLKQAILLYGDSKEIKEDIFYNNAKIVFKL